MVKIEKYFDEKYHCNLNFATINFYVLEELKSLKVDHLPTLQRINAKKLQNEICQYLHEYYAPKFAKTLFDYLAIACIGEARHSSGASKVKWALPFGGCRSNVYEIALEYNPFDFLVKLRDQIFKGKWPSGYGGARWGKLCDRALKYHQVSDVLFIDYCINSMHNGGLAFNKGILLHTEGWDSGVFITLLNYRNKCKSFIEEGWEKYLYYAPNHKRLLLSDVYEFVERATKLGLVNVAVHEIEKCDYLYFPSLKWGDGIIELQKKSSVEEYLEQHVSKSKKPWKIPAHKVVIQKIAYGKYFPFEKARKGLRS